MVFLLWGCDVISEGDFAFFGDKGHLHSLIRGGVGLGVYLLGSHHGLVSEANTVGANCWDWERWAQALEVRVTGGKQVARQNRWLREQNFLSSVSHLAAGRGYL